MQYFEFDAIYNFFFTCASFFKSMLFGKWVAIVANLVVEINGGIGVGQVATLEA